MSPNVSGQDVQFKDNPGNRWGHVFIYHPDLKHILLFGGTRERNGKYLSDTWVWEGGNWKKINVNGPSARGFSAVTYHEKRKTIILHGGRGDDRVTHSDLWEWDGTHWSQLETSSSYQADHHQMVYLNRQNSVLAFGGWNGKEVIGETWQWKNMWQTLEVKSPPGRAAFSMVNNSKSNSVILYGGLWVNGQYADIWKWINNEWQSISEPYSNSSLDHHSMIYDSNRDQVIGFGGKNYRYVFQQNTFVIDDDEVVISNNEGPSGRHSFGFTFDSHKNTGYLYGGKEYIDGTQVALGDFWKWDGENWARVSD